MEKKFNIFYADDDEEDQELFKNVVMEIEDSLNVVIQNNGNELISQLQSPPPAPDVIFLDLNMPVKNGYDALREIREDEKTKEVPVIIFSTSDDEKAIATSRLLGASMYIPKPTSLSSFRKMVRHALSINWDIFIPNENNFVYRA
jgi:CheY-like chemotaxis protein